MGELEADPLSHWLFNFVVSRAKVPSWQVTMCFFFPPKKNQLWSFILVLDSCSEVSLACSASLVTETHHQTISLLFLSPSQGLSLKRNKDKVRKAFSQVVHQYQCYRWCMRQSKVQLTQPELHQFSRTKRQSFFFKRKNLYFIEQ